MRKIYLSIFLFGLGGVCAAQQLQRVKAERNFAVSSPAENNQDNQRSGGSRATIWSDDFSIPSNWTISNDVGNTDNWVIGTTGPSGAFDIAPINSTTAANGFALFDSDLYCSGSQDANLTTANPIDLSAYPAVVLKFEQYYRKYQDDTYIEISTDNTNWTKIEVNSGLGVNAYVPTNPHLVSLNITPYAGGQPQVWIRFNFESLSEGCDYSWMVDDISIEEAPRHSIEMSSANFDRVWTGFELEYTMYPLAQAEGNPLTFEAAVANMGADTQTNLKLVSSVKLAASTVFNDTTLYGTLPAINSDTIISATSFVADTTGVYSVSIYAESDSTISNTISKSFEVTDSVYARDNDSLEGYWRIGRKCGGLQLGHYFDVYTNQKAVSISAFIHNLSVPNAAIRGKIYSATNRGTPIAETELEIVSSADLNNLKTISLLQPIDLIKDSTYLVVVEGLESTDTLLIGSSGTSPEQTSFLYDEVGCYGTANTWYYVTQSPMVRLNMYVAPKNVGIEADKNNLVDLKLFPNPASNSASLVYDLPSSANITLRIADVTGKEVMNINEGNKSAGKQTMNINTSSLTNGVYFYTLTTGNASVTKKLVIVK